MLPLVMVLAFLLMPVLEIYVIIQVGQVIGGWPTVALLLAESLLGGWIVRREGRRAWNTLKETFGRGEMPDRQLADAALVLVGGVLLLTPGFVTDVFGFLFVLPFTRPMVRRLVLAYGTRRLQKAQVHASPLFPPGMGGGLGGGMGGANPFDPFGGRSADPQQPRGPVVRGEVVQDDDPAPKA